MPSSPAVEAKVSLSERAYQELRRRILDCELEPGVLISERGIAGEIGLGIAAVRSALVRLSAEGLVITIPRVGYQVSNFTIEYINNFFEAWRVLGHGIVRLALTNMTNSDRKKLQHLRDRVKALGADADPAKVITEVDRTWEQMVEIAGNPLLGDFFYRMQADMRRLFILALRSDANGQGLTSKMVEAPGFENLPSIEAGEASFENFVDMSQQYIMSVVLGLPVLSKVSLAFR